MVVVWRRLAWGVGAAMGRGAGSGGRLGAGADPRAAAARYASRSPRVTCTARAEATEPTMCANGLVGLAQRGAFGGRTGRRGVGASFDGVGSDHPREPFHGRLLRPPLPAQTCATTRFSRPPMGSARESARLRPGRGNDRGGARPGRRSHSGRDRPRGARPPGRATRPGLRTRWFLPNLNAAA